MSFSISACFHLEQITLGFVVDTLFESAEATDGLPSNTDPDAIFIKLALRAAAVRGHLRRGRRPEAAKGLVWIAAYAVRMLLERDLGLWKQLDESSNHVEIY